MLGCCGLVLGGLSRDPMGRRVAEVKRRSRAGEEVQGRERSLEPLHHQPTVSSRFSIKQMFLLRNSPARTGTSH